MDGPQSQQTLEHLPQTRLIHAFAACHHILKALRNQLICLACEGGDGKHRDNGHPIMEGLPIGRRRCARRSTPGAKAQVECFRLSGFIAFGCRRMDRWKKTRSSPGDLNMLIHTRG